MSESHVFSAAAVVAPHPLAAAAGRDVLVEGGNAVEAAVAAAAVTAVVAQDRAGLMADALWLIGDGRRPGAVRFLDARGQAGAVATLARYRKDDREQVPERGAEAVLTAPGAVAGWAAALDLSKALGGRLPLGRLLEPAITAARDGYAAPRPSARGAILADLVALPGFAATFLIDGAWPAEGAVRRSPALADTLSHLAHAGLGDFGRGDVARELGADLGTLGSPLGRDDLRWTEARWPHPVTHAMGSRGTLSTPPTRDGIALTLALGLLGAGPPRRDEPGDALRLVRVWARAHARLSAAEDYRGLLDPARLAAEADALATNPSSDPLPRPGVLDEHASVIAASDPQGLAIAGVVSMGARFGAGVVLPRTGLLAADRGAAFALSSDAGPVLRPGRRAPFGSVPVLLSRRDGALTAAGFAGPHGALSAGQVMAPLLAGLSLADALERALLTTMRDDEGRPALATGIELDPSLARILADAGYPVHPARPDARDIAAVLRGAAGRVEAGGSTDGVAVTGF